MLLLSVHSVFYVRGQGPKNIWVTKITWDLLLDFLFPTQNWNFLFLRILILKSEKERKININIKACIICILWHKDNALERKRRLFLQNSRGKNDQFLQNPSKIKVRSKFWEKSQNSNTVVSVYVQNQKIKKIYTKMFLPWCQQYHSLDFNKKLKLCNKINYGLRLRCSDQSVSEPWTFWCYQHNHS